MGVNQHHSSGRSRMAKVPRVLQLMVVVNNENDQNSADQFQKWVESYSMHQIFKEIKI